MLVAEGVAHIRHAETGRTYRIYSWEIEFEYVCEVDPDKEDGLVFCANVDHADLGTISWVALDFEDEPIWSTTNSGPHKLIHDLSVELRGFPSAKEAGDPDNFKNMGVPIDIRKRRNERIEVLLEWFISTHESSEPRSTGDSVDGNYIWKNRAVPDARETISREFPNETKSVLDETVEAIDSLLSSTNHISSKVFDEASTIHETHNQISDNSKLDLGGLQAQLGELPSSTLDSAFEIIDGFIRIASQPANSTIPSGDPLLEELRKLVVDLQFALAGTNAYTELANAADEYAKSLASEGLSVKKLYASGVHFQNVTSSALKATEEEHELGTPDESLKNLLQSILELHRSIINRTPEGREILAESKKFILTRMEEDTLKAAFKQILNSLEKQTRLREEEVLNRLEDLAENIGTGPHPEQSNQIAVRTLGDIFLKVLNWCASQGGSTLFGTAVAASGAGAALVANGTAAIDFLVETAPSIQIVVAILGPDIAWVRPLAAVIQKLADIPVSNN